MVVVGARDMDELDRARGRVRTEMFGIFYS
jgi:hypothetical protein